MKHMKLLSALAMMLLAASVSADWSANLLQNSNGEEAGSDGVAAWTVDVGESPPLFRDDEVIYGIESVKSSSLSSILPRTGNYMIEFGTKGTTVRVHQGIDVGTYSRDIDAGIALMRTGGWFRNITQLDLSYTYTLYIGSAQYVLQFLDQGGNSILQHVIFMDNYVNLFAWTQNEVTVGVPPGTRAINMGVQLNGQADSLLGLLADDLYFHVNATPNSDPPILQETGMRGTVYELAGAKVTCKNLGTRKTVKGDLGSFPVWNCTKLSLAGKAGQKVKITITGTMVK